MADTTPIDTNHGRSMGDMRPAAPVDDSGQIVYKVHEGVMRHEMSRRRYDTTEAAELCQRDGSHVRRLCKQLGLGRLAYDSGRKRWLTKTELAVLVKHVKLNGSDGRSRGRRGIKS